MGLLGCRDALIVKSRGEGVPVRELALRFGISRSRVHIIVARPVKEARRREKVGRLQVLLREADDPDRKWSSSFLLEALDFPHLPHHAMRRYFKRDNIQEYSLKELMNFLIPEDAEPNYEPWMSAQAFRTKDIGRKTYKSLIRHLNMQDLGKKFNAEWQQRSEKIKSYME